MRTKRRVPAWVAHILAYLILGFGVAVALHNTASAPQLRGGLINSCERVNVLRAQSNLSNSVSFTVLSNAAIREIRLARTVPKTSKFYKIHIKSADGLVQASRRLFITDLTDCTLAIKDGVKYPFHASEPIGDARTGRLFKASDKILADSQTYLKQQAHLRGVAQRPEQRP